MLRTLIAYIVENPLKTMIKVLYNKETGGLTFETWDGDKLIYSGPSYEMAKQATIPF